MHINNLFTGKLPKLFRLHNYKCYVTRYIYNHSINEYYHKIIRYRIPMIIIWGITVTIKIYNTIALYGRTYCNKYRDTGLPLYHGKCYTFNKRRSLRQRDEKKYFYVESRIRYAMFT